MDLWVQALETLFQAPVGMTEKLKLRENRISAKTSDSPHGIMSL